MPSIADVYVTILPETSRVADGIRRALRTLDDDFYRSGKRWGGEIKRGLGDVGIEVDADTARARRKVQELDRDIDKKRVIKIDHDKSSFASLATAARTVEQNFQTLAITTAAVPNTIASVGGAVTSLTGLLGLLPATVGGAALAFGSLKVATMGFGDAMKNIRDVDKFNESVKQMAPNMQQLAGAVRAALPEIDRLKFTVQDAFGAGLGEQFTKLSSTYLPMFQTAMSQVAGSANTALTTVSQMMQQPGMKMDMQGMLGDTTSAINILSQALAPVVKSFVDIGVVGSGFLPQLAAAATQAASAFGAFIQNARDTGELQGWIQTGIDAFKQLLDIAGNLGGIIGGIMKAAPPGGGLFGTLQALTQMLTDFVNSPAGQGALNTFMTATQQALAALAPAAGALLQAVAPLVGFLGQMVSVIITSVAPSLQTWFEAMAPVIQQIVGALQPVLAALAPVLQQVATMLATQMISGIQQVLPLLVPLVQQFGQFVITMLPLIPQLLQLATVAMPAFQAAMTLVLPYLTKVMEILTQLANVIVPATGAQVSALAGIFTTQWNAISGAVQLAVNIIGPLLDLLSTKIQQILDGPIGKILGVLAGPLPRAIGFITSQPTTANTGSSTPAPMLGTPSAGGAPNAQRQRRGLPPVGPQPLAPAGAFPAAPTPPVSGYVAPPPSSGGGGGGGGTTPSAVSPTGTDWEKVAQGESKGTWNLNTGNGYYGGLQFDLPTWQEFGGTDFAERPDLASKEQQIAVAERVPQAQRPNRWPNTYSAGAVGRPAAGTTPAAATPGYGSGSGSASAATTAGASQDPRTFAHDTMMPYWQGMGLQVGDHAADQYGEHQHGALDIMVPDIATGQQVLQQVLQDPNVYGAIFNRQSYGYGHGAAGQPYTGPNPHTDHVHAWYKPGNAGNINPSGTGGATPYGMADYGTTGGYTTGGYSDSKQVREAQQKVDDTQQRIADEQAKLDKLRTKPGTTPEEIAKQEREVAKAKREHADATNDLAAAQDKYNTAAGKSGKDSGGFSGQDFMAGIAEFFGFDGSLFKNPADFGLVKILGAASKLKPAGGDTTSGDTTGGGGGGLGGLLSFIPQAFGALGQSPSQDAGAGPFTPNMPSADSGGVLGRAFAPPGAPGPGNVIDNSVTVNNPVGEDHLKGAFKTAQEESYPRMRQPLRNVP